MTRLLLLADTHVPKRARRIPEQVWRAVDDADVVIHAGDWVEASVLDELEASVLDELEARATASFATSRWRPSTVTDGLGQCGSVSQPEAADWAYA